VIFPISPVTSYFYYIVHLLVVYANRKKIGKNEIIVLLHEKRKRMVE